MNFLNVLSILIKTINVREIIIINDVSISLHRSKTDWKNNEAWKTHINETNQTRQMLFYYEKTILNITRPKYNVAEREKE